ncbi:hypothetical protein SAMN05428961_110116 [Paenibacillus sp. OK060]|uniref:hypothetical protein n=1 Tax=Paenibacillus sp. OK060 TaxID=1881034 RepID=UPI00088E6E92|nr:hypothetical protein [Paenibacillus sp. OK060]SDM16138.1 hypothetical protein SAMN05428961_110116 [Paenibacillus sp. OK060]
MLLASSVLSFSLLVACNNQQNAGTTTPSNTKKQEAAQNSNNSSTQKQNPSGDIASVFPKSVLTNSITIDSVNENQSIRAEQKTDKGTLLMISNGKEERGHLNVSSTLGQEGDQTFQSNYSIVYRYDGQDKVLLELPAYLFVQPSDKKITFEKMSFKDADVYVLTPQYKTGHGLEGYVFAIDKQSGEGFPLEIVKKDQVSKTLLYSESKPSLSVANDGLVVHPPVGAGTPEEDMKDVIYKLDLSKKQLIAE